MAEINKGDIIDPKEIEAPLEQAKNLEQVIVKLEKIRRSALEAGTAVRSSASTSEIRGLVDQLQKEQDELKKVNLDLQEQIRLLNEKGKKAEDVTRKNKDMQKGLIDLLKDVRIGGVSVGEVLDKLEKANSRVFKQLTEGYRNASISAKLFGNAARTALTLTGIGIFIAALTTLIVYWDDIAKSIGLAATEQEKFFEASKKSASDYSSELEHQLSLMQAMGTEERALTEARILGKREELRQNQELLKAAEENFKEQVKIDRLTGGWFGKVDEAKQSYNETAEAIKKAQRELAILQATQVKQTDDAGEKEKKENEKRAKEAKDARDKEAKAVYESRQKNSDRIIHAARDFMKKDLEIDNQIAVEKIKIQGDVIHATELSNEEILRLNEQRRREDREREISAAQDFIDNMVSKYSFFEDAVGNILGATTQKRLDAIDREEAALEESYAKRIELAGDNVEKTSRLENELAANKERLERKRNEQTRKTAIFEKATNLAMAFINTAKAVLEFGLVTPLAIAAGIAGAVQIAIIAGTKIPSYKKGTKNHPGGLAELHSREAVMYPTGEVYVTPDGTTYSNLPKGTVVLPEKETMHALAMAGLSANIQSDRNIGPEFGKYFRDLIWEVKNQRQPLFNFTPRGVERMFKRGESREFYLNGDYK